MTTPALCVFDIIPPRRPGIDDVGGAAKIDDAEFPPDPVEMPTAADDNQHQNLIVRYGLVVPVAVITVHLTAGVPSVFSVSSVVGSVVTGSFTVTDNGVGDTSLVWTANKFPAPVAGPTANVTGATIGQASAVAITNGVRVKTANAAGAAADLDVVVFLY